MRFHRMGGLCTQAHGTHYVTLGVEYFYLPEFKAGAAIVTELATGHLGRVRREQGLPVDVAPAAFTEDLQAAVLKPWTGGSLCQPQVPLSCGM